MKKLNLFLTISGMFFAMPFVLHSAVYTVNPGESIQAAVDKAGPGDTVEVRAGIYREAVTLKKSGIQGSPVTIKAKEGEQVILEGMHIIDGWQKCTPQDEGLTVQGQVNPHWNNIYWTYIDASMISNIKNLILYEDYQQLFLARTPNQSVASSVNVLEFIPLEAEAWNHDDGTRPDAPGVYTYILDSDYLTQPDGYWNGAWVDIWSHAANNNLARRLIADFNRSEHKLYFDTPLANKIWYGSKPDAYCIVNHPHALDKPGEFFHSMSSTTVDGIWKYKVYLWPENESNLVDKIMLARLRSAFLAFRSTTGSHVVIDGFIIRNYVSSGIFFQAQDSIPFESVLVKNNVVYNVGGTGIGVYRSNNAVVEKNIVFNTMNSGRGIHITNSKNPVIRYNRVYNTDSTCISYYSTTHGKILGNVIGGSIGVHGNGISTYEDCKDILLANNVFLGASPYTMNKTANIIVFNNIFNARDESSFIVVHWANTYMKGLMAVVNNTILNSSSNSGIAVGISTDYPEGGPTDLVDETIVINNIVDGCSWSNTRGEYFIRSHNIYTGYQWTQSPSRNWALAEGEIDGRNIALADIFHRPAEDYFALKDNSVAIDAGDPNIAETIRKFQAIFPEYDFYTDIFGNPRPHGGRWDIGAHEYNGAPLPEKPWWTADVFTPPEFNDRLKPPQDGVVNEYGIPDNVKLEVRNNLLKGTNTPGAQITAGMSISGHLKLVLYDSKGREIFEFWNGDIEAGSHLFTWDGLDKRGARVGSGVYIVHMNANGYKEIKKIVVVR